MKTQEMKNFSDLARDGAPIQVLYCDRKAHTALANTRYKRMTDGHWRHAIVVEFDPTADQDLKSPDRCHVGISFTTNSDPTDDRNVDRWVTAASILSTYAEYVAIRDARRVARECRETREAIEAEALAVERVEAIEALKKAGFNPADLARLLAK